MELNDKELFEQAVSNEPVVETQAEPDVAAVEPAVVAEQAQVETAASRDEKGRFAPKKDEVAAKPEAKADDKEAMVPSWRLREEREAREHLARQLDEMRQQIKANAPKPEPVDFFANPEAAVRQAVTPVEQQFKNFAGMMTFRASKAEAVSEYGKDSVAEMQQWLRDAATAGNPGLAALQTQMENSDHPVGVAMSWFQREKLLKETGGDLTAYKSKTLDEALNDPAFLAKALEKARAHASGQNTQAAQPIVKLPPSIGRATSAASPHEPAGDLSNDSLYSYAIR